MQWPMEPTNEEWNGQKTNHRWAKECETNTESHRREVCLNVRLFQSIRAHIAADTYGILTVP